MCRADTSGLLHVSVTYCSTGSAKHYSKMLVNVSSWHISSCVLLREWWRTPPPRQWLPHHRRWLVSSNRSRWTALPTMFLLTHTSPSKSNSGEGQLLSTIWTWYSLIRVFLFPLFSIIFLIVSSIYCVMGQPFIPYLSLLISVCVWLWLVIFQSMSRSALWSYWICIYSLHPCDVMSLLLSAVYLYQVILRSNTSILPQTGFSLPQWAWLVLDELPVCESFGELKGYYHTKWVSEMFSACVTTKTVRLRGVSVW